MRWLLLLRRAFLARMLNHVSTITVIFRRFAGAVTMAAIFRSMPDLLNIHKSAAARLTQLPRGLVPASDLAARRNFLYLKLKHNTHR
jgi:hypothetical protein